MSTSPFEEEMEAGEQFTTPQKKTATFKRRNRDSVLSPGSLRVGKTSRIHDELMMEKVQTMIKCEIRFMRDDMRKEMHANAESYKNSIHADMDEKCSFMEIAIQNSVRTEVQVMEALMQKKLDKVVAEFESWKKEAESQLEEKTQAIKDLEGKLAVFTNEVQAKTDKLGEELAASKNVLRKEGDSPPLVLKELEEVKEQMKTLKEEEAQKSQVASSWAERLFKTQEKVEEAGKWIADAQQGKVSMTGGTPTSTIINMTIEEEQKRKTRAMHVRITGVKDSGNVEEEVKGLLQRMDISDPSHTSAWRVGKKGLDNKGNERDRALILRFPTLEARKEFLTKRPALKGTGVFLGDDLTLAQVTHMQGLMPEIKAAREKGKIAFYRGGRVIILEKRSNVGSSST